MIAISLIAIVSCKKDEKFINNPSGSVTPSMTIAQGAPSNNGEQLEFNDQQHYDDWIDYLDNTMDDPLTTDEDSTLFFIEQNELVNFHSLRQQFNIDNGLATVGNWIDEDAEFFEEEIDNMFACDFISDDAIKSTLNEHHEVIIGSNLIVFFEENVTLSIDKNETDLIEEIRELEKCGDELPAKYYTEPKVIIINGSTNRATCQYQIDANESGTLYRYSYRAVFKKAPVNCEPFERKFAYSGLRTNMPTSNGWFLQYAASGYKYKIRERQYKVTSYTVGWKVRSNGKYRRKRTHLETRVFGDEKDYFCVSTGNNLNIGKTSSIKRRKLSKRKKVLVKFFDLGFIKSHHELVNEGVTKNHFFTLKYL